MFTDYSAPDDDEPTDVKIKEKNGVGIEMRPTDGGGAASTTAATPMRVPAAVPEEDDDESIYAPPDAPVSFFVE